MSLSIIIPVLNEIESIEKSSLSLIKKRDKADIELIFVDGGSDDGTAEYLHDFALKFNKVLCLNACSKGRALQMNLGAQNADYPCLLFVHADTLLPDDFFEQIMKAMATGYLWGRFDVSLSNPAWYFKMIGFMINLRSRLTKISTGDQGLFIKKTEFLEIEGFSNMPLMEDVDITKRLRKRSLPFLSSLKVVTSSRRWEKHGVIRTVLLMWVLRGLFFLGISPAYFHHWYK